VSQSPSRRCSHITRKGQPCRAWAMHGTDPPVCSVHAGLAGAPPGNQYGRTHGFYSTVLEPDELADLVVYADDLSLDDEIAAARVGLRRVLSALTAAKDDGPASRQAYGHLAGLVFEGARTVARLLRDQRAISGDAAGGLSGAIAQALDELSVEWGIEL